MATKTSWEILYDAMRQEQNKIKSRRLTYSKFCEIMSMTPGLNFTQYSNYYQILEEMQDFGWLRINKAYLKVLNKPVQKAR